MTKAELLTALASAPDDAEVYRDNGFGTLQPVEEVSFHAEQYGPVIVMVFAAHYEDDEP